MSEDKSSKVVRVGTKMMEQIFNELQNLLVKYNNIFVQSHEDMTGINPQILWHQLAVD